MIQAPYATYDEIISQPKAWEEALQEVNKQQDDFSSLWNAGCFDEVIFIGCGSPYFLSVSSACLCQQWLQIPSRAIPSGEILMEPHRHFLTRKRSLLIACSRSAETTETIEAVKLFRQYADGEVIIISNYADRPLSSMGDLRVIIPSGQEISLAQTRSFASMQVAVLAILSTFSGNTKQLDEMQQLPSIGSNWIRQIEESASAIGSDV